MCGSAIIVCLCFLGRMLKKVCFMRVRFLEFWCCDQNPGERKARGHNCFAQQRTTNRYLKRKWRVNSMLTSPSNFIVYPLCNQHNAKYSPSLIISLRVWPTFFLSCVSLHKNKNMHEICVIITHERAYPCTCDSTVCWFVSNINDPQWNMCFASIRTNMYDTDICMHSIMCTVAVDTCYYSNIRHRQQIVTPSNLSWDLRHVCLHGRN